MPKPLSEEVDLPRDLPEVPEGADAFAAGVDVDDCPYPRQDIRRRSWMTGWFDARTAKRLGRLFERNNLSWP